jgi:short-subunit dehydrogenase
MADSPVVVITGASSGIGEAAARHLARARGARVVLVARREDRLEQLAGEIGGGASHVAVDVTAEDGPQRIRDHVAERHGRLDVLVNNAGAAWRERFEDGGYEDVRRTMELNFFAPVRIAEALLPLLRETQGSAIANVASVAGRVARPKTGAYSASKAALISWSDALRAEEADNGVHVGTVLPGFIKTEGFPAKELLAKPTTRWIVSTPERVAEAIEEVAFEHRAERVVPRGYAAFGVMRAVVPRVVFRVVGGGALTTSTGGSDSE